MVSDTCFFNGYCVSKKLEYITSMSLELPSQRTENENQNEKMHFMFEGRKVAFRSTRTSALQSQERLAQVVALETAVAAGHITLEGMSATTDLL